MKSINFFTEIRPGASKNDFRSTSKVGGNCPLMAATSPGKAKVVSLLLTHGARTDGAYGVFGNLLQTASYLGYFDVVNTILEGMREVEVNATGGLTASPPCMAMQHHWKVLNGGQRPGEES